MKVSPNDSSHISQQFDQDLQDLKNHLLVMGGMVEKQIVDASNALINGDSQLVGRIQESERNVDSLEMAIDEECTQVIARRQPAASDLRFVVAIAKMINDLERVGDEAEKISRIAMDLIDEGHSPRGYTEIRQITSHVSKMLHDALDAFTRLDLQLALSVMKEDKHVNTEYISATHTLVEFMMKDNSKTSAVLNVIWVLKALERVGDHARNIAEHIIYMVKGKDVRHATLEEAQEIIQR